MQTGWLKTTVGGRKIEHIRCPNPGGSVDMSAPPAGILHTIEGNLESGIGVFRHHFAPHFALDGRQIVQLLPLGVFGCACENRAGGVETNRLARAQIEVAGNSSTKPWLPDPATTNTLADLLATLEQVADIPLKRPFPDAMPPQPWATTTFSRRNAGKWGKTAGWFGHVEVPENCVAPETPILCADLSWRPAAELETGDEIVAFTDVPEGAPMQMPGRRFATAALVHNYAIRKPCFEIAAGGRVVTASADHPWLVRRPAPRASGAGIRMAWIWVRSDELEDGDLLAELAEPWTGDRSWDAGWLAGILDGDGSLHRSERAEKGIFWQMIVGQRQSRTLERLVDAFDERGFAVTVTERPRDQGFPHRQRFFDVKLLGGRAAVTRLMGEIRPPRFWERADVRSLWEGGRVDRSVKYVPVEEVIAVGEQPVASIETSVGTFITDGFLSHNSHWDPGAFQWKKVLAAARAISKGGKAPMISRRSTTSRAPTKPPAWFWTWLRWRLGEGEFESFGPHSAKNRPELPFGGKGQEPIPAWAWHPAQQFVAARKEPHGKKT
jgi:hypothetical protein